MFAPLVSLLMLVSAASQPTHTEENSSLLAAMGTRLLRDCQCQRSGFRMQRRCGSSPPPRRPRAPRCWGRDPPEKNKTEAGRCSNLRAIPPQQHAGRTHCTDLLRFPVRGLRRVFVWDSASATCSGAQSQAQHAIRPAAAECAAGRRSGSRITKIRGCAALRGDHCAAEGRPAAV